MGRELHRKSAQIQHLQLQVRAHEINIERAKQKIVFLTDQLSEAVRNEADIDSTFHDLLQNREREPHRRGCSRDTMMWARQLYGISPGAWDIVRRVLPLPSERLLRTASVEVQSAVSNGLLHLNEIGTVLDL
jgi:hypothetical protein